MFSIIRLIPIITDVCPRAVVLVPADRPLMMRMFLILVSACFLPMALMMVRLGVFGNGVMLLFGVFACADLFCRPPMLHR